MSETDTYDGPVAFVDGVHYPATVLETVEGGEDGLHADLSRPLRWVEGTTYRDAEDGEASHEDVHHSAHVELDFGSETIDIDPEDAQAVRDFLAQRKGDA